MSNPLASAVVVRPSDEALHNEVTINEVEMEQISRIVQAVEVTLDPRSLQESRNQAHIFLEGLQQDPLAPRYGIILALDSTQSPVIRHHGLSIIDRFLTYSGDRLATALARTVRLWIVHLAESVTEDDPLHIRNKIAKLWVEFAKRWWTADWPHMDELLCSLWAKSLVHKELVAVILESLSEDVFKKEATNASLRTVKLRRACVEIFTPVSVLHGGYPSWDETVPLRYGDEGWLTRLVDFVHEAVFDSRFHSGQGRSCVLKVHAVLKSALRWMSPKAVIECKGALSIFDCLSVHDMSIQAASIESLYVLFSRSIPIIEEFMELAETILEADSVQEMNSLYQWALFDEWDIDEDKYALNKKLSEMVAVVGTSWAERGLLALRDFPREFVVLLVDMFQNPSLAISMPALNTLLTIARSNGNGHGHSDRISSVMETLLKFLTYRLVKYEFLPPNSDDATLVYLREDIDTIPERHAFLGNYRRHCLALVEAIVAMKPFQSLQQILNQTDQVIRNLLSNPHPFQAAEYARNSPTSLYVDAQLAFVEAMLKGYANRENSKGVSPQQNEQDRNHAEDSLEAWCEGLLDIRLEDPILQKRVLQVVTALATSTLKREKLVLKVLTHIFTTDVVDNTDYVAYSEAVKELQHGCTQELHMLAIKIPDFLTTIYEDLEAKINEMLISSALDNRQRISFQSFLFIITHRSTNINDELRVSRLIPAVRSIEESWQDPELNKALDSFEGFCDLVGVNKAQEYLLSRQANRIEDWSSSMLDQQGKAAQAEMNRNSERIPLRITKAFLGASVEKLQKGSAAHAFGGTLWRSAIPVMIPRVLKLLSYSHAYHNIRWAQSSEEMSEIAIRTLSDRFWQSGISTETREDFQAKVSGTKASLEGLASSLRGVIRSTREGCYAVLYSMSRLTEQFYSYDELPEPLAEAFFANAGALSSYQFMGMIGTIRFIMDTCPQSRRQCFLPPILSKLLIQIDAKLTSEWNEITRAKQSNTGDNELTEEMKGESILRQFTHASVLIVAGLLDPQRDEHPEEVASDGMNPQQELAPESMDESGQQPNDGTPPSQESMRAFILSNGAILQPLLEFCTHIIRIPDTRCCTIIARVLSSFCKDVSSVSMTDLSVAAMEHICNDVLQAAITSYHDSNLVDVQRDLIALIVTIYMLFSTSTSTPSKILQSLPGITEVKLTECHDAMFAAHNLRQARGLMANLLEGVRAVNVSELGKIKVSPSSSNRKQKKIKEERKSGGGGGDGGTMVGGISSDDHLIKQGGDDRPIKQERRESPDLNGIEGMFG